MNIGFVGLGIMGGPMARHIAAAHNLLAYDIDASRPALFGLRAADTIATVGAHTEVVFLSLPNSAAVRTVAIGEGGLLHAMRPGAVVIDTSTTEPRVSIEVGTTLAGKGIRFLDAPVSGGEKGAHDATLALMVGGDQATFAEVQPLLRLVGASAVHVGPIGAGEIVKLINNMIVGATFAVVAEGFALARANGIELGRLHEAIRGGWAGSKVLDVAAQDTISGAFRPGGTVDIHSKDLGYARALARESLVPVPVTAAADEIFTAARAAGLGALSQPAVVKLWDELAQKKQK